MVEETKKQPEVELDTDDVNETEIQLKDQPKVKKQEPNLNVGEVDLGYTTYDNKKEEKAQIVIEEQEKTSQPKVETKKEEDTDDLSNLSEGVQKRIDKLTRKYRESERREKAALDYAKALQKKYSEFEQKYDSGEELYIKEYEARIDAQREQAKIKLKEATESQDSTKIMEATDELTRLAVEKEKARRVVIDREQRLKQVKEKPPETFVQPEANIEQIPPQPSEKAKAWAQKNTWFGNDKIMTNAAFTIHEDLVGMGVEVESEEYYNEINKRMTESFPHKFAQEQRKPVQTVASAGRKQEGRRTVRLTKSQVAIAKKLGVPLEEYAKYVKEAN
jgi:hypothetical protein